MTREKTKPNEFIIQNFRSWGGRHYVPLNRLNFLFGGNSSGKSSILAAMSLWRQSIREGVYPNHVLPFCLVGNGKDVKLGPSLQRQFNYGGSNADDWRKSSMAFGCRINKSETIDWLVNEAIEDHHLRDKATVEELQFRELIENVELIVFFDFISGLCKGFDLVINSTVVLAVKFNEFDNIELEICSDADFWEDFYALSSRKNLINEIAETDITIELDEWPRNIRDLYYTFDAKTRDCRNAQFRWKMDVEQAEKERMLIERALEDPVAKEDSGWANAAENTYRNTNEILEERRNKFRETFGFEIDAPLEESTAKLLQRVGGPFANAVEWTSFESFMSGFSKAAKTKLFSSSWKTSAADSLVFDLQCQQLFQLQNGPYKFDDNQDLDIIALACYILFPKGFDLGQFVEACAKAMSRQFLTMVQIGPHRELPDRVGIVDPYNIAESVGKSGENLYDLLYQNTVDELLQGERKPKLVLEINHWFEQLEIGYSLNLSYHPPMDALQILLEDEFSVPASLNDIGYGVSQVLPIVLQCVLSEEKLITIEQPELHIHPRLQANLADLFIWSASVRNNRFVIETHSEHLMLRLQRRQKEQQSQENSEIISESWHSVARSVDICVIQKNSNTGSSHISRLKIDSQGFFDGEWPGGFFEERFVEKGLI